MKCNKCSAEIPPEWVHAIQANMCPSCGGPLMDEMEMVLLSELSEAMKRMPDNPEGVAGWLLSNYKLTKIGDAEPTEFFKQDKRDKQDKQGQPDDVPSDIKIADNPVQKYLQRTGRAKDLSNRRSLKDIVNDINNGVDESMLQPEVEFSDEDDHIAVGKMAISANPPTKEEVVALTEALVLGGQTAPIDGDLPPTLQVDRMKRLAQQQGVATGGGRGSFHRSG